MDPDPELNEIEQQGKAVFTRACATCHGGTLHPSTSTPETTLVRPIVRYHNIQSACPRPVTLGIRMLQDVEQVVTLGVNSTS